MPTEPDAWRGPSSALPELSAVRLDELLHELLDRVGAVTMMQERLRGLLDAVVSVATDLELASVLERIVQAGCKLVGARYGALGVLGPEGKRLSAFITHGLTDDQRAAIGELPSGHGVLGLLIDSPEPLRMPIISEHPESYGFPPNHPMMRSFLGVPVRIHDRVFGNLYLAEKQGAADFSKDDEDIVIALAAAAGVAIENARLYEVSARRQRWLEAGTEISNALLGETDRDTALRLVASRARDVSTSALVALALPSDEQVLRLTVVDGAVEDGVEGQLLDPAGTVIERVMRDGDPAVVEDVQVDEGARSMRESGLLSSAAFGAALVVPLRSSDGVLGVLLLVRDRAERGVYDEDDVQVAQSFAAQAGLALARASALEDRELVAVLGDRDRIARDLHDVVIQRLFATGLSLQGASRRATRPDVSATIETAVDVIDGVIRDIREAIFELNHPREAADITTELRDVIDDSAGPLGFVPTLMIDGSVAPTAWAQVRPHVLAVVREALSNTARHAGAGRASVTLSATARSLRVTVRDDGRGVGDTDRRSGLANLASRAAEVGGSLDVWPAHPTGTIVEWRTPLVR